ncbi:DsrE family protein [Alteromonas facilis]|uniref:DsrE family protein n=1 Tax=Alteromonas facilis TaxID=2048004 RepID=UPI000C287F13|nr:DsrE family protein [Alteromonas facilis]
MNLINRVRHSLIVLCLAGMTLSSSAFAQLSKFSDGPVIEGFGKKVVVGESKFSVDQSFKVAFDVAATGDAGEVNRKFDSLARFINMNVAAGINKENIQLALVVHGKASLDLLNNETYQRAKESDNANIPLLESLMKNNVQVFICGQSMTAYEIAPEQLVDGVQVALSAMTAHALLQQQGYTVNPF